ncbi:unnamed protein product [Boreogadus saida]
MSLLYHRIWESINKKVLQRAGGTLIPAGDIFLPRGGRLYASSELLGIRYIVPDPESELETPAKARREKQTSEHRTVSASCVVQAIRANYLAQDGQYRGYQETVDAQDEL